MLDLAMLIIDELQWKMCGNGRCYYCKGLDPALHVLARQNESVGHIPGCKIRFLNREYEAMRDML